MSGTLPKQWNVPQIFRSRLGAQAGRQRTMAAEDHVLVILHEVPDPTTPEARRAQFFWRDPTGTWRSTLAGKGIVTLREHVETFGKVLDELDQRVEHARSASDYFAVLHRITPLRRTIRNMHQTLQEAREVAKDDKDIITLRDRAGDLERAAELIGTYAKDGLEFTAAKNAEEQAVLAARQNTAAHRLNVLAATCLPVTAIAAVLDINLEHGLEHVSPPWPFLAVVAVAALLGLVVRAAVTRPPPAA
jgi:CorA-like Mg2+ transporter protein